MFGINMRHLIASSVTSGGANLISVFYNYISGQSSTTEPPLISISPKVSSLITSLLVKSIPALSIVPTDLMNTIMSFLIGWILLGVIIWAALRTMGEFLLLGVCLLLGAGALFAILTLGFIKL